MLGGGARTAIISVAFMLVIGLSGLTRKKKRPLMLSSGYQKYD